MKYTKTETVLLIQNDTHWKFWAPDESDNAIVPNWVENAADAKVYKPTCLTLDQALKYPPRWFNETSDRMREWLKNSRMVKAEMTIIVNTIDD